MHRKHALCTLAAQFSPYLLLLGLASAHNSWAAEPAAPSWIDQAVDRIEDIWQAGNQDVYLPFHAYHMRSNYSKEDIREYRENNWGLGYGRSRYNKDGNWEGVYGMAFMDSNSDIEPIVGYGYQWLVGAPNGLHAGAGYTALVTARARFAHYFPIPGVLPMASVGYDKLNLNTTFVPGASGFGQIFFFWGTLTF